MAHHANSAPADALYVVFIGGNDVSDALENPGQPILKNAVQAIDENIRTLILAGAKAILVVNVPDLGLTPKISSLGKRVAKQASHLSYAFNKSLLKHINHIEKELRIDIVNFDFYQFSHSVTDNSIGMGYTNSTEACFDSTTKAFNLGCNSGANFEDYIYFDAFHLTEATNKRIGHALYAVVPELPELTDPGVDERRVRSVHWFDLPRIPHVDDLL